MKDIETGAVYRGVAMPGAGDLASDIGNAGVDVVSSPATIGYLEIACHSVLKPNFEGDEASVGTGFRLQHRAAAHPGAPVEVYAELIGQDGGRYSFKVAAHQDGRLIMDGEHDRAIVHLGRFMKRRSG
jgi:predicted thioesterase